MAGTKRFDEFEDLVRHEALEIAGPNPALHCAKPCCDAGGGAVPPKRATMELTYFKKGPFAAVYCNASDPQLAPGEKMTFYIGEKQHDLARAEGKSTRLVAKGVSTYRAIAAKMNGKYFAGETETFTYTLPYRPGKKSNKEEENMAVIVKPFYDYTSGSNLPIFNPIAAPYKCVPSNMKLAHTKSAQNHYILELIRISYALAGAFGPVKLSDISLKIYLPDFRENAMNEKKRSIGGHRLPTNKRRFGTTVVHAKLEGLLKLFLPGNNVGRETIINTFKALVVQLDVVSPTDSQGFIKGQDAAVAAIKTALCQSSQVYKLYNSLMSDDAAVEKELYETYGHSKGSDIENSAAHYILKKLAVRLLADPQRFGVFDNDRVQSLGAFGFINAADFDVDKVLEFEAKRRHKEINPDLEKQYKSEVLEMKPHDETATDDEYYKQELGKKVAELITGIRVVGPHAELMHVAFDNMTIEDLFICDSSTQCIGTTLKRLKTAVPPPAPNANTNEDSVVAAMCKIVSSRQSNDAVVCHFRAALIDTPVPPVAQPSVEAANDAELSRLGLGNDNLAGNSTDLTSTLWRNGTEAFETA